VFVVLLSVQCSVWGDGGHKSIGSAQLYEWLLPGAGYVYVGEVWRGVGSFALSATFLNAATAESDGSSVFALAFIACRVLAIKDVGKVADEHNDRLPNRGLALAPTIDPVGGGMGLAMGMSF